MAWVNYTLVGSSISVYGTVIHTEGGVQPCGIFTVDSLPSTKYVPKLAQGSVSLYQQLYYASPTMDIGDHTLTLRINSTSTDCQITRGGELWIDFLRYSSVEQSSTPTPTETLSSFSPSSASSSLATHAFGSSSTLTFSFISALPQPPLLGPPSHIYNVVLNT